MAASLPPTPAFPRSPRTPGGTPTTPSSPSFNRKSPTIRRILQEARELSSSPDPSLTAAPLENNLFEWHFTLTGPPSTPYENGIYHGRIVLPATYPLRPPSFRFLTPSGRFEVNREICLSISGHHEETWQPAWGIRTALCAIRAFMSGEAKGQVGGLDMNNESRRKLADESRSWRCGACGAKCNEDVIRELEEEWREANPDGGAGAAVMKIPEELRLAYKDDMERGPPTPGVVVDETATGGTTTVPASPVLTKVPGLQPRAGPVANILARNKPPPSPLRATANASGLDNRLRVTQGPTTGTLRAAGTPALRSALGAAPPLTARSPLTSARIRSPRTPVQESMAGVPQWLDVLIAVIGILLTLFAIGKIFG